MYTPSDEILNKYADVMVNFALWKGKGIKKGDVVLVQIPECTKPFYIPLQTAILKAGGYPIFQYLPDGVNRSFFENASDEQLNFAPIKYWQGQIDEITHYLRVIADSNLHELDGISPSKIMQKTKSNRAFWEMREKKEKEGNYSWSYCLYGTPAMAKEANMSEEEYRDQIIKACFLDEDDPIKKWKESFALLQEKRNILNDMKIQYVHVVGLDEDLKVKIGNDRSWISPDGCNIPSFEIFTSPDCRDINGWVRFNQPLYRYGNLIEGIELEFKDGSVIKASAKKNDDILQEMLKIEGMRQVGEFSLTDRRVSRITKFMAETLFDENVGGQYGNTHIALGLGFNECYNGDQSKLDDSEFKKSIGLNMSAEHVDIISIANRTVTATLEDGSEKVIYENGMFTI